MTVRKTEIARFSSSVNFWLVVIKRNTHYANNLTGDLVFADIITI